MKRRVALSGAVALVFASAEFAAAVARAAEPVALQAVIKPAIVAADDDDPRAARLDKAVTELLQRSARALESRTIEADEEPLFYELLVAGDLLRDDKTLAPSERERLRGLVRVRLQQGVEALKRAAVKNVAQAKPADNAAKIPASVVLPRQTVLAQQFPAGQGFAFGGAVGAAGQANGPVQQRAEELIELITQTIQPESWEQNGGTGVIRYWSPGHAFVIRATSNVHGGLGDLIDQLRK